MGKPKHIILSKEENLILFNKAKAKAISLNPHISSLSDEGALEIVMKYFLDKND